MSIITVKGTGTQKTFVERTPFYGSRLPDELKLLRKLKQLEEPVVKKLLQLAINYLDGKPISHAQFDRLRIGKIREDVINSFYAALLSTMKLAFRCSEAGLTESLFSQDLEELGVPQEFIPLICSGVFNTKSTQVREKVRSHKPSLPSLENMQWRVDVAISTSALYRSLKPCVLVGMKLSNGEEKRFEMSLQKFHELRYNVAYVLKEMEAVEQRSILKISD